MGVKETIKTKDGTLLALTLYLPRTENNHVVVIGSGITMKQEGYKTLAGYLTEKGYVVITFDYRGMGDSGPACTTGFDATMKQWAMQDLNGALLYAKNRFVKKELIFLAHGISGEIAGIAPASGYINRMVLINSALTCWRLRPLRARIGIGMIKLVAPVLLLLYGYFPGRRFRYINNIPKTVMKELIGWCNNSNGLFDEFPDNNYCRLNIPLLAISFSGDAYMPAKAVTALLSRYSNAQIRWLHLSPDEFPAGRIGDNGFFLSDSSVVLWEMLDNWLQSSGSYNGYFNQEEKQVPENRSET